MAFVEPVSKNHRYKVDKISVATPWDKVYQNVGDFNYEVALNQVIYNVIGMSIVEYTFPEDIIPTFYPSTTRITGNNKLDFSLSNPDIGGPTIFSVEFPTKYFQYENVQNNTISYVYNLEQLMNYAISQNPLWKDKVYVSIFPSANYQTLMTVSTVDLSLPPTSSTTLTLLFASGPNSAESAYYVMGFNSQVDVVSSKTVFYFNNETQTIESPSPTRLRAAQYIDVFVEESEVKPLQRIFIEDNGYITNYFSTDGVNRLTFNTSNPPRRIDKLHIRIRYENFGDPGDFQTSPILVPHGFTFHIFSLIDENSANPAYVTKALSY